MNESSSFLKTLERKLKYENYNAIHYFHLTSIAGWYNVYSKIPLVERSTFSPLFLSVGRRFETLSRDRVTVERKVLLEVPIISCQSSGELNTIKQYHQIPSSKLMRIPLGVDTSIYYPKTSFNKILSRKTILLISPNNIKPQKKQLEVLKIVNALKSKKYSIRCVFVGNINNTDYYNEMIDYMNSVALSYMDYTRHFISSSFIKSNADIIFIPSQQEKTLAKIIRSCDMAIFPSTDEGFSLLNLNCISCGTVPICSNISEYSEYMLPGVNAVAIDSNRSWKSYVNVIIKLLKNRRLIKSLSEAAAASAKKFSWEKCARETLKVYEEVIKENKK